MSGASVGCSQPAPCPGRAPLRRCSNREEKNNIVFIDVDSDSFDNVIIIDVPESSERTFRTSEVLRKGRKHPSPRTGVIFLDDDENTEQNFTSSSVQNNAKLNNGASSSMRSHPTSSGLRDSSDVVGDECQFVQENVCPVKLSKCKRTYSGKSFARNCYGLSTDSDSCPSDNDYPDCELVEDSCGKVREQWEKASSRRKVETHNGQSNTGDPDSVFSDARQNVDGPNDCGKHKETLFEGKSGEEKEAPTPFFSKENGDIGFSYKYGKHTSVEADDYGLESILKADFPPDKDDPLNRMKFAEGPSQDFADCVSGRHFEQGGSNSYREKEQVPKGPSSFTCQEQHNVQVNHVEKGFRDRQRTQPGEPCRSKEESYAAKTNLSEPYMSHSKDSASSEWAHGRSSTGAAEKAYQDTASTSDPHFHWSRVHKSSSAKEKLISEQASYLKSGSSGKHVNCGSSNDDKDEHVGTSLYRSSVSDVDCNDGKVCYPDNMRHGHKNPLVSNSFTDEVQTGEAVKSVSHSQQEQQEDKRYDVVPGEGETMPNVEDCIISEREKLKETDEYKRAVEEEWASRQRALQIQAEEAQKLRQLRRRRKAESMRLLDMERRQKQRLKEIRETQKKDKENMNLKEVIRAQVIKELNELEVRCHDMTSLLRGLGTFVSDAVNPSPNEVRSAYKRALLTFHPDRASRSDIRQQVEAEEKFKLISRMKEKLLPTLK